MGHGILGTGRLFSELPSSEIPKLVYRVNFRALMNILKLYPKVRFLCAVVYFSK